MIYDVFLLSVNDFGDGFINRQIVSYQTVRLVLWIIDFKDVLIKIWRQTKHLIWLYNYCDLWICN